MSPVMMPFDITMYFPKSTRSRDSEHLPFGGNLSRVHSVLLCVNPYTAFAVPSFTDSKDTIRVKLKKTGHVTLTTPIRG